MSNYKTALVGLAFTALAALSPVSQATTTLTLSSWLPPSHFVNTDILQPWMQRVSEVTDGRVKIEVLPKPAGTPVRHWELARKGVADITWGNFTYEPERFRHIWFAELPMMGSNTEATSVALWRTYEKYLSENPAFSGVVMLGVGLLGGGQFHHPSKAVVSPGDLQGQKVRMGGPIQKRIIEDLGAVPVSAPGTRAYELLEGGVIDASLHGLESVVNFKLDGKLRYTTIVPNALYDATAFIVINERKFKTLSAEDQKAILEVSGEALSRAWGQVFDQQMAAAEKQLRANGHQFSDPNAELLAQIEAIRANMLQELQEVGPSIGVANYQEMVQFYEDQYKILSQ
ncbi:MAG: TRAP transporter substrate-binding protein [Burkholderiaceae bacterium]|nr:TRAP transporter substrate-binding protein [Burkholderiaceae bacterium]MCD8517022.1 TRAP transporter substrate-binding protein [Burkholderiaceae bacterium]MCD8536931.1 TRAP transporter substrate-binding protein [Burkholderiaceae bacterium]